VLQVTVQFNVYLMVPTHLWGKKLKRKISCKNQRKILID
jgi:hypothetical protein